MKHGAVSIITGILLLSMALPVSTQGGFATNTPAPLPGVMPLAAATPPPFTSAPLSPTAPTTSVAFYALRGWFEADMLSLFEHQLDQTSGTTADELLAAQVTAYELRVRYPAAPADEQLLPLIEKMLALPPHVLELRTWVQRLLLPTLTPPTQTTRLMQDGFALEVQPAQLNADEWRDAVIRVTHTAADGTLRYDDLWIVLGSARGYESVPEAVALQRRPFDTTNAPTLIEVSDINRDGLDELVFTVPDEGPGIHYEIVGLRDDVAVSLIAADQVLRAQVNPSDPASLFRTLGDLQVVEPRAGSRAPGWDCVSQRPVTWTYSNNFYRRQVALNTDFRPQESLGCALLALEPIYAREPLNAIGLINQALDRFPQPGHDRDRALIVLAAQYALAGQPDEAETVIEVVRASAAANSWAAQQANALLLTISDPAANILTLCAALAQTSPQGACDMDGLLMRLLGLIALKTDEDLVTQLGEFGFPVAAVETFNPVGQATREIVTFDLAGASRWAFVAEREGRYRAERFVDPAIPTPGATLDGTLGAARALLQDNDPARAITLIDSLERTLSPAQPPLPAARYLRALAYDLTGSRERARQEYYALWSEDGDSVWGQLAAAHLELRQ